eukprot:SAG22_NODE_431_length_10572_cov_70.070467_3_plen_137_part_00
MPACVTYPPTHPPTHRCCSPRGACCAPIACLLAYTITVLAAGLTVLEDPTLNPNAGGGPGLVPAVGLRKDDPMTAVRWEVELPCRRPPPPGAAELPTAEAEATEAGAAWCGGASVLHGVYYRHIRSNRPAPQRWAI